MADRLSVLNLPENILLEVFSYLSVTDLCRLSGVCAAWNRLANDKILWRNIDLIEHPLPLTKLWKFIRSRADKSVKSLHLCGHMSTAMKWKSDSISDAFLNYLKDTCTSLTQFELRSGNLSNANCSNLPNTIEVLKLTHCLFPTRLPPPYERRFGKLSEETFLPNLRYLDLSLSTQLTNGDLQDIQHKQCLEVLKINMCYRIGESGINNICSHLKNLKQLQIAGTCCTDLNLHTMARNLKFLKCLVLSGCDNISDGGLSPLVDALKKLKELGLAKCAKVSGVGVLQFSMVESLKLMHISKDISDNIVTELQEALPDCKIVHQEIRDYGEMIKQGKFLPNY